MWSKSGTEGESKVNQTLCALRLHSRGYFLCRYVKAGPDPAVKPKSAVLLGALVEVLGELFEVLHQSELEIVLILERLLCGYLVGFLETVARPPVVDFGHAP